VHLGVCVGVCVCACACECVCVCVVCGVSRVSRCAVVCHIFEKRPSNVKRDIHIPKETNPKPTKYVHVVAVQKAVV